MLQPLESNYQSITFAVKCAGRLSGLNLDLPVTCTCGNLQNHLILYAGFFNNAYNCPPNLKIMASHIYNHMDPARCWR